MVRFILPLLILGCAAFFAVRFFERRKEAPVPPPPVVEIPEPLTLSGADMDKIFDATKDPSPQVRWAAIELLYRRADPKADKLIQEAVALETDPQVKWGTIELLYRIRHPDAKKMIKEALAAETDPELRRRALELLKTDTNKETARQLLPALRDPDKQMRSAALSALGARGDKDLAPEILKMLSDPGKASRRIPRPAGRAAQELRGGRRALPPSQAGRGALRRPRGTESRGSRRQMRRRV